MEQREADLELENQASKKLVKKSSQKSKKVRAPDLGQTGTEALSGAYLADWNA